MANIEENQFNEGYAEGHRDGHQEGYDSGYATAYDKGYDVGVSDGQEEGAREGHNEGYREAREELDLEVAHSQELLAIYRDALLELGVSCVDLAIVESSADPIDRLKAEIRHAVSIALIKHL